MPRVASLTQGNNCAYPYALIRAVAATLLCLWSAPLVAQDSALPALPDDVAAQFAAVGRLGQPGFAHQGCTATLIAPDLIVTAAHCLPKDASSGGIFAAGWSRGTSVAQRPVDQRTRHPKYAPNGTHMPHNDVGLAVLSAPITDIAPFALADVAVHDTEVAMVGYHRKVPEQLSGDLSCAAKDMADGLAHVACPVTNGNSGAPLLHQNAQGEWQVVGIISSRIGNGAIATRLPAWLLAQVAAHHAAKPATP